MSDLADTLTIASRIPLLETLDDSNCVFTWVANIHAALDLLGLADFILVRDKLCPEGPHVTAEQRQQWEKDRAKVIWILKTSLVEVWPDLRPDVYAMEKNPRDIYLAVIAKANPDAMWEEWYSKTKADR